MIDSKTNKLRTLLFGSSVAAVVMVTGCATPPPAPIVHRAPTSPTVSTSTVDSTREIYTVGRGDSISSVAQRFGVSVADLLAWNSLPANPVLQAGQVLRLRAPAIVTAPVITPTPSPTEGAQTAPIKPVPSDVTKPIEAKPSIALKTQPKGLKRPYSDATLAEMIKGIAPAIATAPLVNPPLVTPPVTPPVSEVKTPEVKAPEKTSDTKPATETASDGKADAAGRNWSWPAAGAVLQEFDGKKNRGVTIAGTPGKPVLAAAGGKVLYAKDYLDYGKLVIIAHTGDVVSVYAQNNAISIKEGQTVQRGDKIAEQGPRVHFEIRRSGKAVDPSSYLPTR
jgi:lipoprotein NlpD